MNDDWEGGVSVHDVVDISWKKRNEVRTKSGKTAVLETYGVKTRPIAQCRAPWWVQSDGTAVEGASGAAGDAVWAWPKSLFFICENFATQSTEKLALSSMVRDAKVHITSPGAQSSRKKKTKSARKRRGRGWG